MKKIMFVIGYMGNGGAERVVSLLSNCLAERDVNVFIVTIFGDQSDYELNRSIERYAIKCDNKIKLLRPANRIKLLKNYIMDCDPDCVISFLAEVNLYSIIAMHGSNTPLMISERNDPNSDPPQKWKRAFRNFLYRFCDGAVFQTNDAKKYFEKYLGKKCQQDVISNPIKPGLPFKTNWSKTYRFITACRLDEQKNLPLMISAVSDIIDEGNNCTLDIYGRGPLFDFLENYIKDLGKAEHIRLMGFTNDIHSEMCRSDAFIISSNYEGISNSMLEALAVGVPVIATDCPVGGAREFIVNGENGYLVPVNNREELKKRIRLILNNEYDSIRILKSAEHLREILDVERISNRWIADINQLIKRFEENVP